MKVRWRWVTGTVSHLISDLWRWPSVCACCLHPESRSAIIYYLTMGVSKHTRHPLIPLKQSCKFGYCQNWIHCNIAGCPLKQRTLSTLRVQIVLYWQCDVLCNCGFAFFFFLNRWRNSMTHLFQTASSEVSSYSCWHLTTLSATPTTDEDKVNPSSSQLMF